MDNRSDETIGGFPNVLCRQLSGTSLHPMRIPFPGTISKPPNIHLRQPFQVFLRSMDIHSHGHIAGLSSVHLRQDGHMCLHIIRGGSGGYPGLSLADRQIKGKVHWILGNVALSTSKDVLITDTAGTH